MPHILIIDDDAHIREVSEYAFTKAGMRVTQAGNGQEGIEFFEKHHPDLIVLDINMPEKDGLEVCKDIRKISDVPILFLSSRDEEIDRILGLEIGGDDYVTKPFSPRELVARVKAILKRTSGPQEDVSDALVCKALSLDPARREVNFHGKEMDLTAHEFSILETLLRRPGIVFTRDQIMDLSYDMNVHVSDRTIDSHIRHIRHKFGQADIIQTVRGVGYRLGTCE